MFVQFQHTFFTLIEETYTIESATRPGRTLVVGKWGKGGSSMSGGGGCPRWWIRTWASGFPSPITREVSQVKPTTCNSPPLAQNLLILPGPEHHTEARMISYSLVILTFTTSFPDHFQVNFFMPWLLLLTRGNKESHIFQRHILSFFLSPRWKFSCKCN